MSATSVSILIWMETNGQWFVRMRLNNEVQYERLGPFESEGEAMRNAADKMRSWRP